MSQPLRLLIVEDSSDDAELVVRELSRAGFEVLHDQVDDATAFRAALERQDWDVVISDHGLPSFNSTEALRMLRESGREAPFLIVSGSIGEAAAVDAMKSGADDYILKNNLARLGPAVAREVREAEGRRQRRRAEEALLRSEELFRKVSDCSPVGIMLLDYVGECTYANPRCRELLGKTLRESMGPGWLSVVHPDDRTRLMHELHTSLRTKTECTQQFRVVSRTNEERWLRFRSSSLDTDDPALAGVVATLEDITEREKAHNALQASERRYRALVETARDAIFLLDAERNVASVNPAFESITGWPCADWLGKPFVELVDPEDRPRADEMFERVIQGEKPPLFELCMRHRSNESWAGEFTVTPQREDGVTIGVLGIVRDITERKQLEQQFRQVQKMEAIGLLAGGVAHDFNNLLTAILGYSDMLLDRLERDSPLRNNVGEIRKAGERAAALTRQLLAFSRKQLLELQVFDMQRVVAGLVPMLQRLIGTHIELVANAGSPAFVKADPGQVEQVILNLVVNARDAMPEGGRITLTTRINPQNEVELSVKDTGAGIPDDVKPRLFEPFFTTKPTGQGTGLGLATCYGIISQSGGRIEVESEVGKGATFLIHLPRAAEADAPRVAANSPANTPIPVGTETVLLVEDEPVVREMAALILREQGYTVIEARDGREALKLADAHTAPIDLLFTDLIMPALGGRELAQLIRQKFPQTKVLFSSGYSGTDVVQQNVLEPDTAFLRKPYAPSGMARKIREVLDSTAA